MKGLQLTYIIPVFNAERTIVDTLDSLYSVGMLESMFEVIIVDDCSTDSTLSIIREYMLKHSNIRLVCQEYNQKQGAARNIAIPMARGQFISFVDSDDLVEFGITKALQTAIQSNVDVLICQTRALNDAGLYSYHYLAKEQTKVIAGNDFLNKYYHWHLPGAPWGYLFKSDYLYRNGIRFIENHYHEDADWTLKQIYYAKTLFVCPELIYTYVYRENSTVNCLNSMQYADSIFADYRIIQFADSMSNDSPTFAKKCIADRSYSIHGKMIRLWKLSDKDFINFYRRMGDDTRFGIWRLCDKKIVGNKVRFLLEFKHLSLMILYIFAIPIQLIKKII